MRVLGLSAFYHDSAAAPPVDGEIVDSPHMQLMAAGKRSEPKHAASPLSRF